jgi:uncharacterized RDD family membrane protein YckC
MNENDQEFKVVSYLGFWPRVAASLVDNIALTFITGVILSLFGGQSTISEESFAKIVAESSTMSPESAFSMVFGMLVVVLFWVYKQTTPGKMIFSAKIVDAKTGGNPSVFQCIIRYIGYIPSAMVLGLGFFWVAFDKKKQGWHDKMAGTVVIVEEK